MMCVTKKGKFTVIICLFQNNAIKKALDEGYNQLYEQLLLFMQKVWLDMIELVFAGCV